MSVTTYFPADPWMHERAQLFSAAYPTYSDTSLLDDLRTAEYSYLDRHRRVYLDYAGSSLAAKTQLRAHLERITGNCFGNPHSEGPASVASTELIEKTRAVVLDYFRASPEEYSVIFTANATDACRLVGEAYPFGPDTRFVLTLDNHNSVNGIREFARARCSEIEYVPLTAGELRIDRRALHGSLARPARSVRGFSRSPERPSNEFRGLFAYPAQSNLTGVQHPLELVEFAQQQGYDVLLDATAFVPTNRLDLSVVHPDFVPVSWYKLLGHPTGLGCLLVRREALPRLRRPWFSGGTIEAVSAQGNGHILASDEAAYEDGTLNVLSIPDIAAGISWLNQIGIDTVHERVTCLTGWLLENLVGLRHSNGRPLARVYGPTDLNSRGATVAFNFLDPDGRVIDERLVARDASARQISLRTGSFYNPGAGEVAFSIPRQALSGSIRNVPRTIDEYITMLDLPSAGAIRASLGLVSNLADVERFLLLATATYRDTFPDTSGLSPRTHC